MKRLQIGLGVLVAGMLFASNVRAGWRETMQQADSTAAAERTKKGLSGDALKQKYGTPEMLFSRVIDATPGDTVTLVAQGTFQPGTTFVVTSDEVDVVGAKLTARGWEASVRVKPDALPSTVSVQAIAPVSGIHSEQLALHIGGRYALDLVLANGWTSKITCDRNDPEDATISCHAKWFKDGEKKAFRETDIALTPGNGTVNGEIAADPSEYDAAVQDAEAYAKATADDKTLDKLEVIMKKVEACQQLPPAKVEACIAPYQKQADAISAENDARLAQMQNAGAAGKTARAFGCSKVQLNREGGGWHGAVAGCGGENEVALKSVTVRFLGK
jgi:hypothetical protein